MVPLLYLGVMTNKLRLNTDGQEQHTQIGPFMAVFKTMMDGNKLLTDWTAQDQRRSGGGALGAHALR